MRPRDEQGLPLPPAHKRLDMQPFRKAALFALAADPRACALPFARKISLIDRAANHVIDGDRAPAWVWAKDDSRPDNHFLPELWRIAVRECSRVHKHKAGP